MVMPYEYQKERPSVFTEDGQIMFLRIRDRANYLLKEAGACNVECLMRAVTGDSWHMLACVDRLVEIGELVEVKQDERTFGQHRIFVKGGVNG